MVELFQIFANEFFEKSLHQAEKIAEKFQNVTAICADPMNRIFRNEITSEIEDDDLEKLMEQEIE